MKDKNRTGRLEAKAARRDADREAKRQRKEEAAADGDRTTLGQAAVRSRGAGGRSAGRIPIRR
ncbi:hypothetical protein NKH77_56170 [Streptomyces sp. M19]